MFKIKANVKLIPREKIVPPKDNVHRAGKEGFIKGVHSLLFDGRVTPKGSTAFYWRMDEKTGLRVSYSFSWLGPLKEKVVKRDYKLMKQCYQKDIAPKVYGMETVALDLYYEHKKKHIKCFANAIKVQHVQYPAKAWAEYAKGKPYDWECIEDEAHSPEGFLKFVNWAKPLAKGIDTSWKLGDVVYCEKKKRWYLVDCGK